MKKRISSALALLLAVSLLAGCGKSKEVRAVEKSIASIGEVTEETEAAIGDARAQYEALPEEERESVSNYETLQEAEKKIGRTEASGGDQRSRAGDRRHWRGDRGEKGADPERP